MKVGDKVKIKVVSTWITGTIIDFVDADILKWKIKPDAEWKSKIFALRNRIAKGDKNILQLYQGDCPYWCQTECAKDYQCSCRRSDDYDKYINKKPK